MSAEISATFSWLITGGVFIAQLAILYFTSRSERNAEQLREEAEQVEREKQGIATKLAEADHSIRNLQTEVQVYKSELETLKSVQPNLVARPLCLFREPLRKTVPPQPHPGSFALLRITNEPINRNSEATARRLYAHISYCDEQWNNILPLSQALWVDFGEPHNASRDHTIDPVVYSNIDLSPYRSEIHLCLALRYPWEDVPLYYALNSLSNNYPDWLHKDFEISRETTYIKVILGCNLFQTTLYYTLKDLGLEKGLQLEPTPSPTP